MSDRVNTLAVAVVGAGPAGFYVAEALAALAPGARIDLVERLPTPYGLVRSGVAPDHSATKEVEQTFARTLSSGVTFFGNVEVGRDVTLAELSGLYDAVVLATGAADDIRMGIDGEDLPGVYSSAAFVGWYNGHPDHAALAPVVGEGDVVVVGNGNVALDVARVLTRTPAELARTDISTAARDLIAVAPPRDVHIVGRRGPAEARFTSVELTEMGALSGAVALLDGTPVPDGPDPSLPLRERRAVAKNLDCFRTFATADPSARERRIHFRFYLRPVCIIGREKVEGVRFERTRSDGGAVVGTGETVDIPCAVVVSAIGYRPKPLEGLPLEPCGGRALHDGSGRVAPGLYVTGWLRRGPSGKIGTNRIDGEEIAARVVADVAPSGAAGETGLRRLLASRDVAVVDVAGWGLIDAAERAAGGEAPRRKLVAIAQMLALTHRATAEGRGAGERAPTAEANEEDGAAAASWT